MQSLAPTAIREGIGETFIRMIRTEGLLRPVRGMSAMVVGAGPSHALYFSSYEYVKDTLKKSTASTKYHTAVHGRHYFIFLLVFFTSIPFHNVRPQFSNRICLNVS